MTALCLVVLLVLVPVAATADDVRFETSVPEPTLQPGTTQELTFQLSNDAEDIDEYNDPAREVEVTVGETAGIDVLSGPRELGQLGDGATQSVSVRLDVPADIPSGEHRLPVTIEYVDTGDDTETRTVYVTVRVEERPRFAVESVNASAPVGGSGTVAVDITNVGEASANSSVVAFQSGTSDIRFGQSANTRRFVGEWAPNETRTVEVDASIAAAAETREYALDATVEYETGGTSDSSRPLSFGITPLPEQSFAVNSIESSLRVGEEGTLTGTVTNTGETVASNVVVALESTYPNISPLETEAAVGTLEPGETTEFSFDIETSDSARAGPRQFTLAMQYRDAEDTQRTSESVDARVDIAEARDEFAVSPISAEFEAGSGGQLEMEVTNNLDEPVSDVSAKLFVDSPLSSGDDEAFAAELQPGETRTFTFAVSVGSGAQEKVYPANVDFQYETADGNSRISDTYSVPVSATVPEDSGLPLPLIGGVIALIVVLAGGLYYYRR